MSARTREDIKRLEARLEAALSEEENGNPGISFEGLEDMDLDQDDDLMANVNPDPISLASDMKNDQSVWERMELKINELSRSHDSERQRRRHEEYELHRDRRTENWKISRPMLITGHILSQAPPHGAVCPVQGCDNPANARCLTCSPSIVLCADHMHYNHMKFSPFHDYQLFSETKHVYTDFQLPEVTLSAGWACDTNCVISYQSVRLLKDAGSIIIFIFTLFTLL